MTDRFYFYNLNNKDIPVLKKKIYWFHGVEGFHKYNKSQIASVGSVISKTGKHFCFYTFEPNTKKIHYIIPMEVQYGLSSYSRFKAKEQKLTIIGLSSKFDFWNKTAILVWEGDFLPIKINLDDGKYEILKVNKGKKYIKPFYTAKLMDSISKRQWEKTREIRETKMSKTEFVFCHALYFGIIYNIPKKFREDNKSRMVQIFNYSGTLLDHFQVKAEYVSKYYFRKSDTSLYILSTQIKDDLDEDIIISKYRISN